MTENPNWKAPGHENCSWGYKRVKCDYCAAEYTCLPHSDYYCVNLDFTGGDIKHACEPCLLRLMGSPGRLVVVTQDGDEVTRHDIVQPAEPDGGDDQ